MAPGPIVLRPATPAGDPPAQLRTGRPALAKITA